MTTDTSSLGRTSSVAWGMSALGLDALAEVLFCSNLQPSEQPTSVEVFHALARSLERVGDPVGDCAAQLASDYGKDPDAACERMRWARATVRAFTD